MPYFLAMSPTLRSSSAPSFPSSLNPAVMTMTASAPLMPDSSMTEGTSVLGTHITTSSTFPGTAVSEG